MLDRVDRVWQLVLGVEKEQECEMLCLFALQSRGRLSLLNRRMVPALRAMLPEIPGLYSFS